MPQELETEKFGPGPLPDLEVMLDLYRTMVRIRQFEERVYYLFLEGRLPGTIHLYNGQEAVAAGICANLGQADYITSTHRPHGHAIAKGVSIPSMMAELFAKSTGCCGGKGGSMHVGDIRVGAVPSIAITAGGVPVAAGLGLACHRLGKGQAVACFFGEGATNEGAFHEGVNIAAIWDLPVVFVCENNLYGASTHVSKVMKVEHVADRASAYGIPGVVVDGNDVLAVYAAAKTAFTRARQGQGPTLLECKTYRHGGHSRSDPGHYRSKEEVEFWKARDPITRLSTQLLAANLVAESQIAAVEQEVQQEITDAISFAEESPSPAPEDALTDVFWEEPA